MKITGKKFIMCLSVLLSITLIMSSCSKKVAQTDNKGENVKLKWVCTGAGKQKDSDAVWQEFNTKLKDYLPNTEVEIEIIPGGNFGERWQLMMASSEKVDIAWSGYAIPSFIGEVEKGAYLPLDKLIQEDAPDILKEFPDWLLELGKVNGEVYCIPNYQIMSTSPFGIHTKKEYADKYMDIGAIQAKYNEWAANSNAGKELYGLFENYFKKLKDNGLINKGVGVGTIKGFSDKATYDSTTITGFSIDTDTKQVIIDDMSDYKKLWYDVAADWYKKGYIRNDILSENVDGIDEAEKGYILWGHGYYDKTSESIESTKKGFATKVFGLGDKYYIKNNIPATSTCIARTCENPARAMKVIELMNTKKGKDLYNMLVYGLEGKHYKKVSDNRIETLGYVTYADADSLYGLNKWAIGNTSNAYETQVDPEGYADYVRSLDDNAQILPTVGFKPDVSDISVEIAQVATVTKEYAELSYGALPNYQEVYSEYMEKLKTAGALKIRDELQKQLDEWLQKSKK